MNEAGMQILVEEKKFSRSLRCLYDPKCPLNRNYPCCDPTSPEASQKCGKLGGLREISLTKELRKMDAKLR